MVAEIMIIPGSEREALKAGAQYVGRGLAAVGVKVREQISVCPDAAKLQQAVAAGLARSNVLVLLGGMARHNGFLAKQVISKGLDLPLEPSRECLTAIKEYCKKSGEPFEVDDLDLAALPKGSIPFPGRYGKLPGCLVSSSRQHIVLLPETQQDIAAMFNHYVVPKLSSQQASTAVTRTLRTYGVREHTVREMLADLTATANPVVTIHREGNEVLVRVTANAQAGPQAAALCTPVLRTIVDRLGDAAYGLDVDSLESAVVQKVEKKSRELAVAEAGTAGMMTRLLGETPGGSRILRYSVAADDDEAKVKKLGASPKLLKKKGSVSEYAAVAMAAGAREKTDAGGIGVGVAANTADPYNKKCPLGQVFVAVCDEENVYVKKLIIGDGDASTDVIIDAAVSRALHMTRLFVDYLPEPYPGSISLSAALKGKTVTDKQSYDDDTGEEGTAERGSGNSTIGKDEPQNKMKKLVFILAMLVFVGSAGYLGKHYLDSFLAARLAGQLQNMYMFGDMEDMEISADFPRTYLKNFAALWTMNNDVVAFINIPDTTVMYPIVQSDDNDYYLRRDFNEASSQHGIPFMDYRVELDGNYDNMVIYGHNMKDGQIFGELMSYKELDYYKEHPVIGFDTLYEEGQFKIFALFIADASPPEGDTDFQYHNFITAASEADFNYFVSQVQARSLVNTNVDVRYGDELLTLSSCTYEFDDARFVVVARKVRRGEDPDVDVTSAKKNPSPLMPDVYYRLYGGSKPATQSVPIATSDAASQVLPALPAGDLVLREEESAQAAEPFTREAQRSGMLAMTAPNTLTMLDTGYGAGLPGPTPLRSSRPERVDTDRGKGSAGSGTVKTPSGSPKSSGNSAISDRDSVLKVYVDGVYREVEAEDLLAQIVQNEVGPSFHPEALKAQAVAAFTYLTHQNRSGVIPSVYTTAKVDSRVEQAVSQVLGERLYYNGKIAFTPYHATSAGATTSSKDVWGGGYPYLTTVESPLEESLSNFQVRTTMSADKVSGLIESKLGIEVYGDPEDWFEVLDYAQGGYNGAMAVCGETKSGKTGSKITGRLLRETVFSLRSACFTVEYDSSSDSFVFTTYGYGHGVGMSQNGANLYAKQGWSYQEILEHYYPGTTVR